MARLTETKIKVSRIALIEALKTALSKHEEIHKRHVVKNETAMEKARAEILAKLSNPDRLIDTASTRRYGGQLTLTVSSRTEVPGVPKDSACELRNTIAVLELSNEATIPLTADQYQSYFPCAVDNG